MLRWMVGAVVLIAACGGGGDSNGGGETPITMGGVVYPVTEVQDLMRDDIAAIGWDEACAQLFEMDVGERALETATMIELGIVPDEETAERLFELYEEVCNDDRH